MNEDKYIFVFNNTGVFYVLYALSMYIISWMCYPCYVDSFILKHKSKC